jgi:hypothetical protein
MKKQKDIKIEQKTVFLFESNNSGSKTSTDPTLATITVITTGTRMFDGFSRNADKPTPG